MYKVSFEWLLFWTPSSFIVHFHCVPKDFVVWLLSRRGKDKLGTSQRKELHSVERKKNREIISQEGRNHFSRRKITTGDHWWVRKAAAFSLEPTVNCLEMKALSKTVVFDSRRPTTLTPLTPTSDLGGYAAKSCWTGISQSSLTFGWVRPLRAAWR